MGEFKLTDEQGAVVESMARGRESLMVSAYAGCAKSTTIVAGAGGVKVPALALAFNRRIAEELKPRLPANWNVRTLNGLGMQAWARARSGQQLSIDDRKLGKLVTQTAKDARCELSETAWGDLRDLVSYAMGRGIVPAEEEEFGFVGLTPDDPQAWVDLADDLMLGEEDTKLLVPMAGEVLRRSITLARQGTISFDDQVYCSTLLGGRFTPYPFVAVDEAQDLSPLNHAMLQRALRSDGRLVAVGDEKQAIYGFRGADTDSMRNIRRLRSGWVDLPLATTFRCTQSVVARQQAHAPGFRAAASCKPGTLRELLAPWDPELAERWDGWGWEALAEYVAEGLRLAVLCRNNAPLVKLALALLRQQVPVVMLGRDLGKGLAALVRRLAPEALAMPRFLAALGAWEEAEASKLLVAGKDAAPVHDRVECLRALSTSASDTKGLLGVLESMFARERGVVELASIHRAKGLEWDVVVHLDPWRPRRLAAKLAQSDPAASRQERNLIYVAETRTRDVLVEANWEDFR